MKKTLISSVLGLVGAWVLFSMLVGVDTVDVVTYNKVERHVGTAAFSAGDLVSISPDGARTDFLCGMDLEDGVLREVPLQKSYTNVLHDSLPLFVQMASWTKRFLTGQDTPDTPTVATGTRVDFDGRLVSFPQGGARPVMDDNCTCAVAEKLIRRHRVCMVNTSLNEKVLVFQDFTQPDLGRRVEERTVGVTYRQFPMVIPDVQALACPNIASAAFIPDSDQTCGGADGLWTATWLRDKFGVIRENDLILVSVPLE